MKEEERKKSNQLLQERMQKPLTGNLALNFMFKDQDLANIIKIKAAKSEDVRQSMNIPSSANKNPSG